MDGRARVACLEYVLRFLHADSLVFVHDFSPRSYYHHAIGNYYTVVPPRIFFGVALGLQCNALMLA